MWSQVSAAVASALLVIVPVGGTVIYLYLQKLSTSLHGHIDAVQTQVDTATSIVEGVKKTQDQIVTRVGGKVDG